MMLMIDVLDVAQTLIRPPTVASVAVSTVLVGPSTTQSCRDLDRQRVTTAGVPGVILCFSDSVQFSSSEASSGCTTCAAAPFPPTARPAAPLSAAPVALQLLHRLDAQRDHCAEGLPVLGGVARLHGQGFRVRLRVKVG